jgi:hypothetical protein
MHEIKIFFLLFFFLIFATFQRKFGILIPDLYFYSVKNTNQY